MTMQEHNQDAAFTAEQVKLLNALLNLNGKVDGVEARHDRRMDRFDEEIVKLNARIDQLEQLMIDGFNRLETLNRNAIGFQTPSRE